MPSNTLTRRNQSRRYELYGQQDFDSVVDPDDGYYNVDDLSSVGPLPYEGRIGENDLEAVASSSGDGTDVYQERNRIFDEIANKALHPTELHYMLESFTKSRDMPFQRTYTRAKVVKERLPHAMVPKVGLIFLPGGDLAEVNRAEGHGMINEKPDQRNPAWRVNTAGSLLAAPTINRDLAVEMSDGTAMLVNTVMAREKREALQSRSKRVDLSSVQRDSVIVDSEEVLLCNEDPLGKFDLCATLIEVNVSSLMALIWDYRAIVRDSGPNMQSKEVLDRMIENARRFILNSPVLFRMSTRTFVINAKDIRYGTNNDQQFSTFTTNQGIQEIIMMSASYFNSLDPSVPGMDDITQKSIRPRFLQMLTLLLSLLNETDRINISTFLERTYGLSSERQDLELLFCKVIPLTSINSKVFLEALVPAIHCKSVKVEGPTSYQHVWRIFLKNLAQRGYLLPGTIEELGDERWSWAVKWPTHGICSTTALARLQKHGQLMDVFNEIPPARFHYEADIKEVSVILTNNETYTIHANDHDKISVLSKGTYTLTHCSDGSICDLVISETVLNLDINQAIRLINDAMLRLNFQNKPDSLSRSLIRKIRPDPQVFQDIRAAARLTRNDAVLHGSRLALAYKLDGKNVPKTEALRHMSDSYNKVRTLFDWLCERAGRNLPLFEKYVARVNHFLNLDRQFYSEEKRPVNIADSPIARAYHPDSMTPVIAPPWCPYRVTYEFDAYTRQELLHIWAKHGTVTNVIWHHPGNQAEVFIERTPGSFLVSPLKPVTEQEQGDEVSQGDLALLVGRYMVIASTHAVDVHAPCTMMNWLELKETYVPQQSRRRRNDTVHDPPQVKTFR